jgi:ABC-type amino acid transport system permease subunit
MGRAIAALVIGIILLIGVLWLASRLSHHLHGHGGTVIKVVALIGIAAIAYWLLGQGLVFDYFTQ